MQFSLAGANPLTPDYLMTSYGECELQLTAPLLCDPLTPAPPWLADTLVQLNCWPPVASNAPINPVPVLIEAPLEHDPEVVEVADVALVEVALEVLH
jgi:hypothetical protein